MYSKRYELTFGSFALHTASTWDTKTLVYTSTGNTFGECLCLFITGNADNISVTVYIGTHREAYISHVLLQKHTRLGVEIRGKRSKTVLNSDDATLESF